MYKNAGPLFLMILFLNCTSVDPETERILTEEYPRVYELIYNRDGDQILDFVNHSDSLVRVQAWSALIQSPVEDLDRLIQNVMSANTKESWASLWFKELDEKHLDYFNSLWNESPHLRKGLLVLFTEVGNRNTFELLLGVDETGDPDFDYKLAHATGSRSRTIELTSEEEIILIDKALDSKDGEVSQAYLYGYYRARKQFSPEAEQHLLNRWSDYYPTSDEGNQSLVRIMGKNHMNRVLQHFPIESYERMNVQLAVEIAQTISVNESTDYTPIILNALLDHRNPNVQIASLQAIRRHPEITEMLFGDIMNKIALIDYRDPRARMVGFNSISNPGRYVNEMMQVAGEEPSLQSLKYDVLEKIYTPDELLGLIKADYKKEERLLRFYAVQKLAGWWPEVDSDFKEANKESVREIVMEIAMSGDRSMTSASTPLLMDSILFPDDDYQTFENLFTNFGLPEDVEVYQSIFQVLFTRFEEEAQGLIDSLSAIGNQALNQTLLSQGWNIESGDFSSQEFRTPDWNRVAKLTENPYVVIETTKGEIILLLDISKAPVTIAGMDSLMKAGAYQGTPFHRVISNFVIQGGDVETKDGFGGPGYVVPTEASSSMYNRGVVGIASAGTDTEGSQFFIMHQWKPHLNGRYTVIGKVVEGMEVVDRIVQGDVIDRMYWY